MEKKIKTRLILFLLIGLIIFSLIGILALNKREAQSSFFCSQIII